MNTVSNEQCNESESPKKVDEKINIETHVEEKVNSNAVALSKRLEEIVGLMHTVNQRLENLSIERRTRISQKQWTTLEEFKASTKTAVKPTKFWQKSLFARTDFVDKDLDDSFQNVMKYCALFYNHLNDFNGKVQCRGDGVVEENVENFTNQQGSTVETLNNVSPREPIASGSPTKTSKATKSAIMSAGESNDNLEDVNGIRQSFTDLIRSKIEFDSQFLNFNTILSKNCYSEDFHCLYEICANSNIILGQTSLSIDKRGSDNKRVKRKRLSSNVMEKSQKKKLRSSARATSEDDSAEIQVIRSFRRRQSA